MLSPRAQKYLTFRSGFHRAFGCSRSKHVRIPCAVSRDQLHHRLRFCCDSFFLHLHLFACFRHHFKTIDGTEIADVEQTQKMIPFVTCEISLGQYVCEFVLGVNVFDLDFGVQIDSIEQPMFWKHVSLSGFFPLWSSWSLVRCFQTHTTKLPDGKNLRLRK